MRRGPILATAGVAAGDTGNYDYPSRGLILDLAEFFRMVILLGISLIFDPSTGPSYEQ